MRSDADWLRDILDAIAVIERYLPASRDKFDNDEPLQSHLLRQLQIIGEAVSRISDATKSKHANVPWRQIAGMRNVIIHAYFQIDWNEVWNTVAHDIPKMKSQVEALLTSIQNMD
jgi:uncharacterized protein with HEPN domain